MQEFGRYAYYAFCSAAERRVRKLTSQKLFHPDSFDSILASGLGFGFASALVQLGRPLELALGPGSSYTSTCRAFSFQLNSAIHTSVMAMLNLILMVLAVEGYKRRSRLRVAAVFLIHLLASTATSLNSLQDGCLISLCLLTAVTLLAGVWAGKQLGRELREVGT
mmetsp:Transcript_7016/g.24480  ORF Transcript_7016/g.24480 Transcript_7016/m.24480 type:complete len:165 (-) Transcript_7016:38-532(-)